jgi:NCAIR mutase (PurE)-related protein
VGRVRRPGKPSSRTQLDVGEFARYDLGRVSRTGVPEVILAEGKHPDHLVGILRALAKQGHGAIVSRLSPKVRGRLDREVKLGLPMTFHAHGRMGLLEPRRPARRTSHGVAAVVTAGTADVPIAEEAVTVLESQGAAVITAFDVGVAGLHRLTRALRRLERSQPSVYLVFAGREGALPTIVAGLVRAPVVGVPTSVGYGRGGKGEAALTAMLQSCAPIAVVNIDAAVSAALFALQLLGSRSQTD